jgi:putative CocE/NonD family hydrolase
VATGRRTLYLASHAGEASDAFRSGTLAGAAPGSGAASAAPDHYVDDPRDLHRGALQEHAEDTPLTDQTEALTLGGDGVIYHSEPFNEATEISGWVKLGVWMSLDVPDTDFAVTLYEVKADGGSVLLTSDILRARYRHSPTQEDLVTPGAIERYDFDGFTWFSRRVGKGSRLRLVLTSPNSIFMEKNYNSGKVVATESGADARVAHVTIYHDAAHPSSLELPLVQ